MASGAVHYRIAETLLDIAAQGATTDEFNVLTVLTPDQCASVVARAQVHATLAAAAAAAIPIVGELLIEPDDIAREWAVVVK